MPASNIRQNVMKIVKEKKKGKALVSALKKAVKPSAVKNAKKRV